MDPYNPNVFSLPGYYPTMDPNPFSQLSANTFAGFQHSLSVFSSTQQTQALQNLMMRNPFNMQPIQASRPTQPVQTSQPLEPNEDDIEVVPETQLQSSKRKKRKTSCG
ncbi:hypothetical protein Hanom_Chr12g01120371 [Helianthus anomalus]